ENAYRQLHRTALDALQKKARSWKSEPANDGSQTDAAKTPSLRTAGVSTPVLLRGDEMLIVACSEGLLAGAPSGMVKVMTHPSDSSDDDLDADDDTKSDAQPSKERRDKTSRTDDPAGQTVGLILVCQHSTSETSGVSGTDDRREKQDQETTYQRDGTMKSDPAKADGQLMPGVYCVKRSGRLVWLADEAGQVVLKTTLDAQRGNLGAKATDGYGRDDDEEPASRAGKKHQRETVVAMGGNQTRNDWDHIFSALAKEAMNSMGWAKNDMPPSKR
ncbi:MAG: hypothetical protein KDB53_11330, partial [Planctomycetes bacterium]|nr:hypothetical protein [Planctomycetota bacterium]